MITHMKILAVSNHKGGVGKTTIVHNAGVILSERGKRILLVDMDPQASLTGAMGAGDCAGKSMAEVIGGHLPGRLSLKSILHHVAPNLDLAPSDLAMANVELGLSQRMGRENVLGKILAGAAADYDLVILDCGPSLGLLTVNALVAAHEVLIPTQASILDLRGVSLFLQSIETIRAELNSDLKLFGIVVNQYDSRYTHHRDAVKTLQDAGLPVLPVFIGRSVKVAEASGAGQPISEYEPRNPQTHNFRKLAGLLENWLSQK